MFATVRESEYVTRANTGLRPSVTVNADKALIVCAEKRLQELREQRLRLLGKEKPVQG
jgi:hypothetical protein